MDRPHVLLACGSDWQAPARLPKLFQRAGCHVTIFCPHDWGMTKTKFVDAAIDAPVELTGFVAALRSYLALNPGKYGWIVAIDDPLLTALVARKSEAWVAEILPIDGGALFVDALANKATFAKHAETLRLRTPPSRVCASVEAAVAYAREIGFPVVLKVAESYAGLGVRKAESETDLVNAWAELKVCDPAVVQKYVVGRLGNTAALFSRGVPICSMSAFKSRTWPGELGPSSARAFMNHDAIAPMLDSFGDVTAYDGFAAFDWIVDQDGALYVIELNARPVPALHMASHVGVDFSRAIFDFIAARAAGHTKIDARLAQRPRVESANRAILPMFPEDLYRAITENDLAGIAQFASGGLGFQDIPWDDPPLLTHLLRRRSTKRAFDSLFATAVSETLRPLSFSAEPVR